MSVWSVDVEISVRLTRDQRVGVFNAIEEDPRSPLDGYVGDARGNRESAWVSVEAPSAQEAAALATEIVAEGLRRIGISAEVLSAEVEDADRRIVDAKPVRLRV